ncbi:MAG: TAXI family TRAP transporter solute-binding subunit [Oscillospiraceae bacterium]|nr:TAXI family TRAP transporter solute-binding subunit [Oscillospiraceae bacterium]
MWKKTAALLLAALVLLGGCSKTEDPGKQYRFATGGTSGTYYTFGNYMAAIWDKYAGCHTEILSTDGSVTNLGMLANGETDFAIAQNDILYYALNGAEMFAEHKLKGVSVVAALYAKTVQVVVPAESEVTSVGGLAGKVVAVGESGTATEAAARAILEAHGISYDDITVKYQNFSDASESMAKGAADAAFVVSALPSAGVLEYIKTHDVRLLSMTSVASAKLIEQYPFFSYATVTADVYGTDISCATLSVEALLVCRSDLPADEVEAMLSALFENLDELASAHVKGAEVNAETAYSSKVGAYHGGAKRYFE